MSKPRVTVRASDLGDILTSGTTGFTIRKKTGVGLFFHFFLLGCLVILGTALLVHYQSPEGCALAVAIGFSMAIIAHNLEKMKRIKLSLEFMNALFSSALGKGYLFCFVVKSSGEIVFFNRPFQAVFPAFLHENTRSLNVLFDTYNLPEDHRTQMKALISSNAEGSVTTEIRAKAATTSQPMTFYFDPIERPTGFMMVRGK